MTSAGATGAGPDVALLTAWLDPAAATQLFDGLREALPWQVHQVRMFGRAIDAPRLSCWIGDEDAAYRYSGVRHAPHPWPAALRPLRARLAGETGIDFNSVLANLYRDGRDCMGWHSDDERELGQRPLIASLSLGAERRFLLRHRQDPARRLALALPHGSLLLMRGDTQAAWRHALPRTARPVGARINLTFRLIAPA
ncbi:alpha-ketoglutarate-dependent dioxygenase AlkB family protein [Luteimonas sp. SDU82]|uniref:alpha-ketoglutarate-dependent dioxygenase AlkB family protein n=1 Tax=Luteimonas sp. SDU82 TaxID=3422592 RepID=UPI003EBE45B2